MVNVLAHENATVEGEEADWKSFKAMDMEKKRTDTRTKETTN